jgi:hypothetical protein
VVVQTARAEIWNPPLTSWRRVFAALVLFGFAFGYVEAAVVVYLRHIYDPIRAQLHPGREPGELLPLITADQLHAAAPQLERLLVVELGREAATLIMLASVAAVGAATRRQWFAGFCVAFGVWDLAFYLFLKILVDWPASLLTWDILFLLPLPWVAPVLAPVIVAATMAFAGAIALKRDIHGPAMMFSRAHWTLLLAGGVMIVVSFVWDFRNTTAGNMPNPFNWPLFAAGQALGCGVFAHALMRRR